jgi:phosphate transport system substrate-binding protein
MSPKKLMTHWAAGRCCVDLRTGEYRVNQLRAITVAGLLAATVLPAVAVEISGAGATFPYPLYAKWADTYRKETGIGLNYQSIGSGGGIKQIEAKTVTFGATDAPLKGEELDKFGLVQFPMVMGGIVPVVNIEGMKPGELVLDGPAVAAIFLGKVKSWDDPAIKKLNPNAKLPSQAIAVVHRSDGSGTTFNFTYYLALVSPDWKSQVGSNTSVEWPIGIGAKGNEGVSNNVSQAKGSIGYVEYAYARQNKMTYTKMVNKDGKTVAPTAEAFILMPKQPPDPVAAAEALKFFAWAYAKGDKMAEELDYVPMPKKVVEDIEKVWAREIKDFSGKPLHVSSAMAQ